MTSRTRLLFMLVLIVAIGCSGQVAVSGTAPVDEHTIATTPATIAVATAPPRPAPPAATPSSTVPEPVWVIGAELLPLRPDGLGEIGPTPEPLIDRRLPTLSLLPPPPSDAYAWSVSGVDAGVADRMGSTWSPGCPVGLDDLRYLTVSFWGFDGRHHTGELIVAHEVAEDIVWVFERLHAERFPIEEMRLITSADLEAPPTGDGNLTASFVCRSVRGGSSWSAHAVGLAVDINPFHNPYRRGAIVLPERASAYLDRDWVRPGMIMAGDVVTESFAAIGWHWGGNWSSPDYMHFSATGR